ncbi:hypothetical protein [Pedobacter jamesrossensis]|uniref:Uncharacterized protein n=1 Tax=Pedobacter jamesrossensis TaxID=1908238 RepID=A0ABV8NIF4_9SPHI
MEKHLKKPSKNRIIHLDNDEMANPIKVVNDFFSASWLPEQLKMLKQWRNDAAFETEEARNYSPASLLFDHKLTIKLLEAAWLLKDKKLGRIKIDVETEDNIAKWYIKTERKKLRDYPKHLTVLEIIKPSSVIKKMFRIHKLDGYRRILNIWLYDALSTGFMEESLSKSEVITVYEQLVKLFEAMWLISQCIKTKD